MSVHSLQPTPYQDVNAFLNRMLSSIEAVLGDQFVGLYLGGSLAIGDFNEHRSDIDFIAISVDEFRPETILALEEMHARLWATNDKWAMKLDGSYVPREVFRCWTPDQAPCPFVEGDNFSITNQGSAVIQRHIVRQHGVVIAGPNPRAWIAPVSADDLRNALHDMLERWWRPLLDDPGWIRQSKEQPFAIFTMCRALYALEHGEVCSKPVAAKWVQKATGEQWRAVIEWALAWPHNAKSNCLASTLSIIEYTLNRYQRHVERVSSSTTKQ